jgi:hypothetical protein
MDDKVFRVTWIESFLLRDKADAKFSIVTNVLTCNIL